MGMSVRNNTKSKRVADKTVICKCGRYMEGKRYDLILGGLTEGNLVTTNCKKELEIDFITRKLVKREKTRTMSKRERRKMEVSRMNSEQKEVTNMQTDNRLLEEMLSNENLNKAFLQVVRNKGAEGIDGMKYTKLKDYLKEHGEEIKEQIRTRKYKPKPVRKVGISKADGGVRNLGVPTVVDRFIQQAIVQILTPIYEPLFSEHSFGF